MRLGRAGFLKHPWICEEMLLLCIDFMPVPPCENPVCRSPAHVPRDQGLSRSCFSLATCYEAISTLRLACSIILPSNTAAWLSPMAGRTYAPFDLWNSSFLRGLEAPQKHVWHTVYDSWEGCLILSLCQNGCTQPHSLQTSFFLQEEEKENSGLQLYDTKKMIIFPL